MSGLLFSVFTAVHLLNTALAALGPAAYNRFQRAVRPVYQAPGVELVLVLAPLAVHIAAGIARMRLRKGQKSPSSPRVRAHRVAGYFLLLVILGHVGATRLASLLYGVYPEFEGLAYTFEFAPYYFYPYYPLLGLAGVVHAALGIPLALGTLGLRLPPALRRGPGLWVPLALSAAAVLIGVMGLGHLLYPLPELSNGPYAVLLREVTGRFTGR